MCNVVPSVLRNHWTGFFPVYCCLKPQGQHCIRSWPVQRCPESIKTILNRIFSCALLSGASWTTLHKVFTCVMLAHGLTDNFYEENNLYHVVSTILGRHCIGILYSQCCPNMSETTLHKINAFTMLAQNAQKSFCRKITYIMLSRSACANVAQENCLPVQCWPTAHEQLCTGK